MNDLIRLGHLLLKGEGGGGGARIVMYTLYKNKKDMYATLSIQAVCDCQLGLSLKPYMCKL